MSIEQLELILSDSFLVPRCGSGAGGLFGVSLVLGFACGIARLPNSPPAPEPHRPKITRKGALA